MSKIDNSPPAFPRPASEYTKNGTCSDGNDAIDWAPGMTLRDWFAGMALQGILAKFHEDRIMLDVVDDAYSYADTMLERREK